MTRNATRAELSADSVCVIGVPWDEHSSMLRGPAEAPPKIREVLMSGSSNLSAENLLDLGVDARVIDVGDVDLGEDAMSAIERAIADVASSGARVLVLGGDHAVTYPVLRGMAACYEHLTIVHFDAHPDLYDELEGDRLSHACPFARIMEDGLARRLIQIGIRTLNHHQRAQAERFGVDIITMDEFRPDIELDVTGPVYVSIDLDALDPAFAPGVSHHEPGGLTSRDIVRLIQRLPVSPVGADIVEYNPRRDIHDMTAAVCVKLYKELVARMLT